MLQNPNIRPPMNKEQLVQLLKENCGAKEVANRPGQFIIKDPNKETGIYLDMRFYPLEQYVTCESDRKLNVVIKRKEDDLYGDSALSQLMMPATYESLWHFAKCMQLHWFAAMLEGE